MMKTIIIDDEENARITLEYLIKEYAPQLSIIGSYGSLAEACPAIEEKKPAVIFLDIQMPDESGLNLWKYFPKPDFHVIFTTAFEQYALHAIRLSALDYLLKPIDIEELVRITEKLMLQTSTQRIEDRLAVLEANMNNSNASNAQIVLSTTNSLIVIKTERIVRCESDNNYTHFFLEDNTKHTVCKTLKEYESILPSTVFFRVHQSHLINLNFIKRYIKGKKNVVEMVDGKMVPVSIKKKEMLINLLS